MNKLCAGVILAALLALGPVGVATRASAAPDLSVRQNHLLFQFAEHQGRTVCGIQEIVVIENGGKEPFQDPSGTARLSVPSGALEVSPVPVPSMMPGAETNRPLDPEEYEIRADHILVKRHLHPGKNTFSYAYLLPVQDDRLLLEKKIFYPTRLMVSFAPPVDRLTSKTLSVEKTEDGYKIMGSGLATDAVVDLTFEGISKSVMAENRSRPGGEVDGGVSPAGEAPAPAPDRRDPFSSKLRLYLIPSVAGAGLAILVFLYSLSLRRSNSLRADWRKFVMDEMESLDAAAEKKEVTVDFHKRKKKEWMNRLRGLD